MNKITIQPSSDLPTAALTHLLDIIRTLLAFNIVTNSCWSNS